MAILVICTNGECGELFDAPDDRAGEQVPCPACGQAVTVPSADAAEPAPGKTKPRRPAARPTPAPSEPHDDEDVVDLEIEAKTGADASAAEPTEPGEGDDEIDLTLLAEQEIATPEPPASAPSPPPGDERAMDLTPADRPQAEPPPLPSARGKGKPAAGEPSPADQDEEVVDLWGEEPEEEPEFVDQGAAVTASTSEEALSSPLATLAILLVGLIAMSFAAVAGFYIWTSHPILGAYVGGVLGWVGGFVVSLMSVLAADHEAAARVNCPTCGAALDEDAIACPWCDTRIEQTGGMHPLAANCLRAGRYATGRGGAIAALATIVVFAYLIAAAAWVAVRVYPEPLAQWTPAMYVLWGLLGFLAMSYWMEFLATAVSQTISQRNRPPKLPPAFSLGQFATGAQTLGLLAIYLAPIVTLPLLPIGLLRLGSAEAFNPRSALRTVTRRGMEFSITWLFVLLWSAVETLGVIVIGGLWNLAAAAIPATVGENTVMVARLFVGAFAVAALAVLSAICLLAVFRCIGMFGRYTRTASTGLSVRDFGDFD